MRRDWALRLCLEARYQLMQTLWNYFVALTFLNVRCGREGQNPFQTGKTLRCYRLKIFNDSFFFFPEGFNSDVIEFDLNTPWVHTGNTSDTLSTIFRDLRRRREILLKSKSDDRTHNELRKPSGENVLRQGSAVIQNPNRTLTSQCCRTEMETVMKGSFRRPVALHSYLSPAERCW